MIGGVFPLFLPLLLLLNLLPLLSPHFLPHFLPLPPFLHRPLHPPLPPHPFTPLLLSFALPFYLTHFIGTGHPPWPPPPKCGRRHRPCRPPRPGNLFNTSKQPINTHVYRPCRPHCPGESYITTRYHLKSVLAKRYTKRYINAFSSFSLLLSFPCCYIPSPLRPFFVPSSSPLCSV